LIGDASRRLAGRQSRRAQHSMKVGSCIHRQGWKVSRRRKPKVRRTTAPRDAATDESRRLYWKVRPEDWQPGESRGARRKAQPEGWSKAKAGDWRKRGAEKLIAGESLRSARRRSRKIGRRRKSQIRLERQPEGATADESRRLGLRQSRKVDQEKQVISVGWKAELED